MGEHRDDEYEEFTECVNESLNNDFREIPDSKEFEMVEGTLKRMLSLKETKIQVDSILSEYLSCYRIMGYDLHGNEVTLHRYNNSMESSSLKNIFMEEFSRYMTDNAKNSKDEPPK